MLSAGGARASSPAVLGLVQQGQTHEAAGRDDVAARRYAEALSIDASCGPAYLALGALRMRLGDLREAELVYSAALAHVPDLYAAYAGRARVRRARGDMPLATRDMEAYAAGRPDPRALKELAAWYGETGLAPAQLAVWRRIRAALEQEPTTDDTTHGLQEARTMVQALQLLVGPADPVTNPARPTTIRQAIARLARSGL